MDNKLFLKIPFALGLSAFSLCVTLKRIKTNKDQTIAKLVKKVQQMEAVIEAQQKMIQQLQDSYELALEPKLTQRFSKSGSIQTFFGTSDTLSDFQSECHDLLLSKDQWYRDALLDDVDMQIIYGNNSHSLNGLFFFPSFYSLLLLLCDQITFSKCTLLHLRPPLLLIH